MKNQKGFIPILFILVASLVIASGTSVVLYKKDKLPFIKATVSNVLNNKSETINDVEKNIEIKEENKSTETNIPKTTKSLDVVENKKTSEEDLEIEKVKREIEATKLELGKTKQELKQIQEETKKQTINLSQPEKQKVVNRESQNVSFTPNISNTELYPTLYQDNRGNIYQGSAFDKSRLQTTGSLVWGTNPECFTSDNVMMDCKTASEIFQWIKNRSVNIDDNLSIVFNVANPQNNQIFYRVSSNVLEGKVSINDPALMQDWQPNNNINIPITERMFYASFQSELKIRTSSPYNISLYNVGEFRINLCFNDKPQLPDKTGMCIEMLYFIHKPNKTYINPLAIISPLKKSYFVSGEEIEFNGFESLSLNGSIVSYKWFSSDKTYPQQQGGANLSKAKFTFGAIDIPKNYTVYLEIMDTLGYKHKTQIGVRILPN